METRENPEEALLRQTIRGELDRIRHKGFHEFRAERDCPTLADLCREPDKSETKTDVVQDRLMGLLDPDPKDPTRKSAKLIAGRNRRDEGLTNRIIFGEPTTSVAIPRHGVDEIPDTKSGDKPEILKQGTPSRMDGVGERNKFLTDLREESLTKIGGSRRNDGRVGRVHDLLDRLADQIVAERDPSAVTTKEASDKASPAARTDGVDKPPVSEGIRTADRSPSRWLPSHRRRALMIAWPVVIAACVAIVIVLASRGAGPFGDTPIHKDDCLSQLAADGVGGAGQIEGGNIVRATVAGREFRDPATIQTGTETAIRMRLSNPGPNSIGAVCVSAEIPKQATPSPSVSMTAASLPTVIPEEKSDTVSIRTEPSTPVCLLYKPGSTELLDKNGAAIETLPDQILDGGVRAGPIDVPLESLRMVQFRVVVTPMAAGSSCDGEQIAAASDPDLPPPGTIVNAQTGAWHPPSKGRNVKHTGGRLASGRILIGCNITEQQMRECLFDADNLPEAKPGDLVRYVMPLHNPTNDPIPILKLQVHLVAYGDRIEAFPSARWPVKNSRDPNGLPATRSHPSSATQTFTLLEQSTKSPRYIPGSTRLLSDLHRDGGADTLISRLPDGITQTGIKLANVGAPKGVWDGDREYLRYVEFQVRIT